MQTQTSDPSDKTVQEHYTVENLEARILTALEAMGVESQNLAADDLAPVDEFHVRGRQATIELLSTVTIDASAHVLDVGCGIGGTARFLAAQTGCRVTGVDLTPEYCRVAESLSKRVGLDERTDFVCASALNLPFEDATFDYASTEHVQMNVADKLAFYREIARVLRPGGRLLFYDIFAGEGSPDYPVPWASRVEFSHLVTPSTARAAIEEAGLTVESWTDSTDKAKSWAAGVGAKLSNGGLPPLSIALHLGADPTSILRNMFAGFQDGKLRTIQAVVRKA